MTVSDREKRLEAALEYVQHHLRCGGLYGPWREWARQCVDAALATPAQEQGESEPGDPICAVDCPCCGASLEVEYGEDEGQIAVYGKRTTRQAACADCLVYERGECGGNGERATLTCHSFEADPCSVCIAAPPSRRQRGQPPVEPTADAVEILHRRYITTPERQASMEQERQPPVEPGEGEAGPGTESGPGRQPPPDAGVREALEAARSLAVKRRHYDCEDSWYSCPKSDGGCCNDAEGDECNCGANDWNAKVDRVLEIIARALTGKGEGG